MKISIIVPTLNEASNIGRLIPHLLSNKAKEKELIVVDGGSTDGTIDIVNGLNVKLVTCEASRSKQLNLGASLAKYPNLYFVHADTLPPVDFYTDVSKVLQNGKSAMCYQSKFIGGSKLLKLNSYFTRFNWLASRGGDQSLFITKDLFNELGQFDEAMELMEEYPLIKKLIEAEALEINPKKIKISTRKYIDNSWLRVSRANYVAFKMYQKGIKSSEIKKRYSELLQ